MGLVSHPSPGPQRVDAPGVEVIDTIEMKEPQQIAHAPGVVAVLDSFPSSDPNAFMGRTARIRTPAGLSIAAPIEAVRDHGTTISFFFRGLARADIPIGSRIVFDDEPRPLGKATDGRRVG